jgi:hypothetical protein
MLGQDCSRQKNKISIKKHPPNSRMANSAQILLKKLDYWKITLQIPIKHALSIHLMMREN